MLTRTRSAHQVSVTLLTGTGGLLVAAALMFSLRGGRHQQQQQQQQRGRELHCACVAGGRELARLGLVGLRHEGAGSAGEPTAASAARRGGRTSAKESTGVCWPRPATPARRLTRSLSLWCGALSWRDGCPQDARRDEVARCHTECPRSQELHVRADGACDAGRTAPWYARGEMRPSWVPTHRCARSCRTKLTSASHVCTRARRKSFLVPVKTPDVCSLREKGYWL